MKEKGNGLTEEKIRILLVDDHCVLRESLANTLGREPDLVVVGEAENGMAAMEMVNRDAPDIVLMDISMPDIDGVEATRRILKDHPECKILALSMHYEREYVRKMVKAGAAGYLLKDCSCRELTRAIRIIVNEDKAYLSPDITVCVIEGYLEPNDKKTASVLTEREQEVLGHIADGFSTREIAEKLKVSPKTVETHRRQIMRKLNIFNVAQLTKYAIREGLTALGC